MLRHKDIMHNWKCSKRTATQYLDAFEEEVNRLDSVLPDTALARFGRTRLVEEEAFAYFMCKAEMLKDSTARKRIPKFIRRKDEM